MNRITARPRFGVVVLLTLCLLPSLAAAQIPQFDCFYVFGDSLADNGNTLIQTTKMGLKPPVPPSASPHRSYFDGRFSNGYIAFEYLWKFLSHHKLDSAMALQPFLESPFGQKGCAFNFAFGGTGTAYVDQTPGGFWSPGLKGQVELFRLALRGRKPSPRSLYAIVTGANDYGPEDGPPNPGAVVGNIKAAIDRLYELGARHVIVLDLPDLGMIPGYPPSASVVSAAHNAELKKAIADLKARYPKLTLIPVELAPLFDDLQSDDPYGGQIPLMALLPGAPAGIAACLFVNPASCINMDSLFFNSDMHFLFWDIVHPTTEAHQRLAEEIHLQLGNAYK